MKRMTFASMTALKAALMNLAEDDPACEDLCQDKATAVAFFNEYLKNENK